MRESKELQPPRWATQFLNWYCKPELAEDLEGDLHEYFDRNVKSVGVRKARLIYIADVFKFIRLYTIRQPDFINSLTQWIMLRSYVKTSGRSILRNRVFSSINIIGLAISMSVGLLMIGLLNDMKSYDKFHANGDRIYRVISKYKYLLKEDKNYYASTSLRAGKAIEESIPGIEKVAIMLRGIDGDFKANETVVPLSGFWSNNATMEVFTFPLVSGDPSTALKEPFSAVLTETAAKKLFGDHDPIGKTVVAPGDKTFTVTGVMKDIPTFSHVHFDILASLSTREITEKDNKRELAWHNMWNGYVYLLLPRNADLENLQANLTALAKNEDKTTDNTSIKLDLQPLSDIALGPELNNSIGPVMGSSNVWMIGILTFIVILSACFNYTNLSIARALRRSKEVGIRKVIGALKRQVIGQFITEAVLISLIALVLAFGIYAFVRPAFLSIDYSFSNMLRLELSFEVIMYFIAMAFIIGIIAGTVPAFFFSKVNAIQVLKNISAAPAFRRVTIRKALIVAQFTVSMMFIAVTIIGYKHYNKLLTFNLGYKTEDILNIRMQGNNPDLLTKQLREIPEVQKLSGSLMVSSVGNYHGTNVKYDNPHDSAFVYQNIVDENYFPLHGHQFLAGRNFISPASDSAAETEVIVNEKIIKRFNIGALDPSKAVGETILVNRKKLQIVGVLKDFHYGKPIDEKIPEVVFVYNRKPQQYVNAKVVTTDWPATRAKIEAAWKKIDNVHQLDASFYDDQIEDSYRDYSSKIKVMGSLSFLAICIAAIGLLGMVIFTTETRIKEISIRKVLGATEAGLVYLMSRGFIVLLSVAAVIALPSTYFFFSKYALDYYADDAPFPVVELTLGVMAIMTFALLMIVTHTLKAARTNPSDVLKTE
jgi:putative ABC transport system permease protein